MYSEYVSDLTVICPEGLRHDANQLAGVMGLSIDDLNTFDICGHEDSDGNLYSITTVRIKSNFMGIFQGTLQRPDFDTDEVIDMDIANAIRASVVWDMYDDLPNKLTCAINRDIAEVMEITGLSHMPLEE